jgi:3-dehydroquinate synthetase
MYTVFRVRDPLNRIELVEQVGRELNEIVPGSFTGLDRGKSVGTRFSCSILQSDDWEQHQDAMFRFMETCSGVLERSRGIGFAVSMDMAVDVEVSNRLRIMSFQIGMRLAEAIVRFQVPFTVSVYAPIKISEVANAEERPK